MHRGPAVLASLAATALLVIGLPGPAQAAGGRLVYLQPNGAPAEVTNPPSGPCLNVQGFEASNQTDSPAVLFRAVGCADGPTLFVPPGGQGGNFVFRSVRFLR